MFRHVTEPGAKTCAECGGPLPPGVTKRRVHCGPACRQKAYAKREKERIAAVVHSVAETGSDTARSAEDFPEGSARRCAELLVVEARQLADALDAAAEPGVALEALRTQVERRVEALTALIPDATSVSVPSLETMHVPPLGAKPDITSAGENHWTVSIGGVTIGMVELVTFSRWTFGTRTEHSEWSGRTAGGREVWSGGPPRDLDDAARMIASDLRQWLAAKHRLTVKPNLGRARIDGSRAVGSGEVRPVTFPARWWTAETYPGAGWTAHPGKGKAPILDRDGQPVVRSDAAAAARVLTEWRWQQADDFWCGRDVNEAWRPTEGQDGERPPTSDPGLLH